MDRQSRARNIILFNVPDHSTSADQQNDSSLVDEIFNAISVPTKPLSVHRLGKPSDKPRPIIRVVMPSPSDVFQILKSNGSYLMLTNLKLYEFHPTKHCNSVSCIILLSLK